MNQTMGTKEYLSNRVATGNEAQLVAILYEGLMEELANAKEKIKEEQLDEVRVSLNKGRDILAELLATLQGDTEITHNLRSLYLFVNQLMTEASNKNNPVKLEQAIQVINPLYEAWTQLGQELYEDKAPLQKNAAIVTGLTYGKGHLTDHVMNDNERWKKG